MLGSSEPYPVCALIELLPVYLGFLARLGVIHPTEMDTALAEIKTLLGPARASIRGFGADIHAIRNLESACSAQALDAIRQDPALSEARGQPLIVLPPAPDPLADARIYLFKVTYLLADDVWFLVEMPSDQTLNDLHRAIQAAAEFDNDHMYSFYLSSRAWDQETEYSTRESRHSSRTRVRELPLRLKQRFLYIFDFGDEHRFEVQLIGAGPADGPSGSWRIVERHGTMPPQYGPADGDEEWEEGDEAGLDWDFVGGEDA